MVKLINFIVRFVEFWLLANLIAVYLQIYQINNFKSMSSSAPPHLTAQQERQREITHFVEVNSTDSIKHEQGVAVESMVNLAKQINKIFIEYIVGSNEPHHLTNPALKSWLLSFNQIKRFVNGGPSGIIHLLGINGPLIALQTVQYVKYENTLEYDDAETNAWRDKVDDLLEDTEYAGLHSLLNLIKEWNGAFFSRVESDPPIPSEVEAVLVALQDYDNHKDIAGIHENYRMLDYKDSDLFRWSMRFLCEVDCEGFTDKYNVLKPWLNQVMFKIVFKRWKKVQLRGIDGKTDVPEFEDYEAFKKWNEWAIKLMYDVVLDREAKAKARDEEESDGDESGENKNDDESEENHNELRDVVPHKPLFDDDVVHKKKFDQYKKDIRAKRNKNGNRNGGTKATKKKKKRKTKKRKRAEKDQDDENDDCNDGPEPKRRRRGDDIIIESDHSDHPLNDKLKKLHGPSPPPYNEDIFTKSGCNNKISLKEIIKQAKKDAKQQYNDEINITQEADDNDDVTKAKIIESYENTIIYDQVRRQQNNIEKESQRFIIDKSKKVIAIGVDSFETVKLFSQQNCIKELAKLDTGLKGKFKDLCQGIVEEIPRDSIAIIIRKADYMKYFEDEVEESDEQSEEERRVLAIRKLLPSSLSFRDISKIMKKMKDRVEHSENAEAIRIRKLLDEVWPAIENKPKKFNRKEQLAAIKKVIDVLYDDFMFKGVLGIVRIVQSEFGLSFHPIMDNISESINENWKEKDVKFINYDCGGALWLHRKCHVINVDDCQEFWSFLNKKSRKKEEDKGIYDMNFDIMQFNDSSRSVTSNNNLSVKTIKSMDWDWYGPKEKQVAKDKEYGIEWIVKKIKNKQNSSKSRAIIELQPGENLMDGIDTATYEYCQSATFQDWMKGRWTVFSGYNEEVKVKIINSLKKEKHCLMNQYQELLCGVQSIMDEDEDGDVSLRDKLNNFLASLGNRN